MASSSAACVLCSLYLYNNNYNNIYLLSIRFYQLLNQPQYYFSTRLQCAINQPTVNINLKGVQTITKLTGKFIQFAFYFISVRQLQVLNNRSFECFAQWFITKVFCIMLCSCSNVVLINFPICNRNLLVLSWSSNFGEGGCVRIFCD